MLLDIGVLHEKNWQQTRMVIREELAAGENDDKANHARHNVRIKQVEKGKALTMQRLLR